MTERPRGFETTPNTLNRSAQRLRDVFAAAFRSATAKTIEREIMTFSPRFHVERSKVANAVRSDEVFDLLLRAQRWRLPDGATRDLGRKNATFMARPSPLPLTVS